jgi:hypothetical protein
MKSVYIFKNYGYYDLEFFYWYYEYSPGKFSPGFDTYTEAGEDARGFGYNVSVLSFLAA